MTDSAPPEDASSPAPVAKLAASRWEKLWGQLIRFRWPIAVAAVVILALVALALVQLPTVWQTIVTIASVGAVLSGLAGYWSTYHTVKKGVPLPASTQAPVAASALSVMVLPFRNLTGDPNQAYVADGLTASLTADLSRIRDAFIVNAATAFAYKDKLLTAQQVAEELGVHFVLQGSVQRNGTMIRINAQLADATSHAQLWSDTFEGDQSDLFALQDQVTARIGNSIGREIVIVAARESETRKSNPKAADLMLRARALLLKPQSLKNWQQIEDLYRQVLTLEPMNSNAMAELAATLVLESSNFGSQLDESEKERKYAEGHGLAMKAKALDPDNPRLYVAILLYALDHDDYEGALRAATTRLSLEPKDPLAYNTLATMFLTGGQPTKAIELLTQAINLDPKRPDEVVLNSMGRAYFMLGDNAAAIDWLQKSLERSALLLSTNAFLAMAYALKGDEANARAATANLRQIAPNFRLLAREKPSSSYPAAYKQWYEAKLIPASRKAGLPE
ncbi:MAG TPA: tetratricopeptide repeat protein [Casimicrobiaceae bacterium]|jgi:TolB-like protein/Flp pilus assembly protein TadD|nr:tetratricopeptide repeat protein [Casimicrobiaceae bacterium]